MQPTTTQPPPPSQPPLQQAAPQAAYGATNPATAAKNKKRGLMFILLPFGLLAFSFLLILINSIIGGVTESKDSALHVILNAIAFLIGGIGALGFIPFIILGIVYLVKKS